MNDDLHRFSPAHPDWDAEGNPVSPRYQDVYFSGNQALQESTHVFIQGNQLDERWRALGDRDFTIGECGFGTGVNFLNCCRLWCEKASPCSTLHYLACDLHPLQPEALARSLQKYTELKSYSDFLLEQYPELVPGIHAREFQFQNRRIRLTLLFGDAADMFARIWQPRGARVDAWFLDGFAPAKNPGMWSPALCRELAKLSHAGTTLTTYSAAGTVKRNLQAAGFHVARRPGFEKKRHMLFCSMGNIRVPQPLTQPAWFSLPPAASPRSCSKGTAIVIGGGMAGCSSAHALARSGWQITVIEKAADIAAGASGNHRGIVHCKVTSGHTASAEFQRLSYLHALQHYRNLAQQVDIGWQQCGLLQLAQQPREKLRHAGFLQEDFTGALAFQVNAAEASRLSGLSLDPEALFFSGGAHLSPPLLCRAYLQHPSISCRTGTEVSRLAYDNGQWSVYSGDDLLGAAEVVIIANSHDAHRLVQSRHYPLTQAFGQIDHYAANPASKRLSCIICSAAYLIPCPDGSTVLGGLSRYANQPALSTVQAGQANRDLLKDMDPALKTAFDACGPLYSRQGWRCGSPDYLPLAGPVEDRAACEEIYGGLRRNAHQKITQEPVYEPGLYLSIAHGAHGLTSTPLIADYLAALINGSPLPVSNRVASALHPIRFLIRQLKRQESGTA